MYLIFRKSAILDHSEAIFTDTCVLPCKIQ